MPDKDFVLAEVSKLTAPGSTPAHFKGERTAPAVPLHDTEGVIKSLVDRVKRLEIQLHEARAGVPRGQHVPQAAESLAHDAHRTHESPSQTREILEAVEKLVNTQVQAQFKALLDDLRRLELERASASIGMTETLERLDQQQELLATGYQTVNKSLLSLEAYQASRLEDIAQAIASWQAQGREKDLDTRNLMTTSFGALTESHTMLHKESVASQEAITQSMLTLGESLVNLEKNQAARFEGILQAIKLQETQRLEFERGIQQVLASNFLRLNEKLDKLEGQAGTSYEGMLRTTEKVGTSLMDLLVKHAQTERAQREESENRIVGEIAGVNRTLGTLETNQGATLESVTGVVSSLETTNAAQFRAVNNFLGSLDKSQVNFNEALGILSKNDQTILTAVEESQLLGNDLRETVEANFAATNNAIINLRSPPSSLIKELDATRRSVLALEANQAALLNEVKELAKARVNPQPVYADMAVIDQRSEIPIPQILSSRRGSDGGLEMEVISPNGARYWVSQQHLDSFLAANQIK
ncbi:hypothetical protein BC832DRAFT_595742 [Gaertneriomyces semiglobifer]|nr:hypothetical protein BC832DRAFT_595742 [Gaertneriomyces semiglobifer]